MEEKLIKLTESVYKLLEYFPESDPLKNRAKDKALAIMEDLRLEDVDILLGYLQIAKSQNWLSAINFFIISNEYEAIKKEFRPVTKPVQSTQKRVNIVLNNSSNFSERQKKIIELLEKEEKAQVMDLQKVLPNITKRTIRRDLDELLQAGKVLREGEFNQVFYRLKR
jgi:hypothetical protein